MQTKSKKNKAVKKSEKVEEFKKRMLVWDSPVEYVNNMYGCHANSVKVGYFDKVYKYETNKL